MPFALPPGSNTSTTGVRLQVDSPRGFTVTTPFWYGPPAPLPGELDALLPQPPADQPPPDYVHRWVSVPVGGTDLGSVPGALWGLVASYGRHTLAVVLHDHLAGLAREAPAAERFPRCAAADEVFRQALRDPDPQTARFRAPAFRALVLWTGASLARYWQFHRVGFAALVAAVLGAWLAAAWCLQNLGGRAAPVAGWVLLLVAAVALAVGAWFDRRLGPLQREGAARASDVWLVRALVCTSVVVGLAGLWTLMPLPGPDVPGWLAILGAAAFVAGSLFLLRSPVRRDALLPLLVALTGLPVGLVGAVTLGALYLLWLPDAFGDTGGGPVNTVRSSSEGN